MKLASDFIMNTFRRGCAEHPALDTRTAKGGTCTPLTWHMISWLHRFTNRYQAARITPVPGIRTADNALRLQALTNLAKGLSVTAHFPAASLEHNVPNIVQTMRFALHLKDRRTFVDASEKRRDW